MLKGISSHVAFMVAGLAMGMASETTSVPASLAAWPKHAPSVRSGNNRAVRSASRHAKTKAAHKARMKQRLKAKKG